MQNILSLSPMLASQVAQRPLQAPHRLIRRKRRRFVVDHELREFGEEVELVVRVQALEHWGQGFVTTLAEAVLVEETSLSRVA